MRSKAFRRHRFLKVAIAHDRGLDLAAHWFLRSLILTRWRRRADVRMSCARASVALRRYFDGRPIALAFRDALPVRRRRATSESMRKKMRASPQFANKTSFTLRRLSD